VSPSEGGEDPWDGDPDGSGPPPLDRVFDTGLQHERTVLAWDRTGLALLVVGALALRAGGAPFDGFLHVPSYVAMVVGASLLWAGGRHYARREVRLRAGGSPVQPGLVRLTGLATVAVSLSALVLVLAG
jgi:uncharacterized membrane protein YidH (DUF202 family)